MKIVDEIEKAIKGTVACPKCGREFKNENSMRMHKMRVHTKAGRTGAMWRKLGILPKKEKEAILAKRRIYKAKLRAKNIARGLTGAGKPRKRSVRFNTMDPEAKKLRRRAYNRKWYADKKAREAYETSPERREMKREWVAQKRAEKRDRILAVYPLPGKEYLQGANIEGRHSINNCPYCGRNIAKHIAIGEGTDE